ncbi:phytoene/squalene synthase family protein [Marilutibacter chinensis]|uniref:Phytoene/squalene synthase family protein n=1 Tax=Marilutibacter chinensis TaxID=2912247 RepID=A0ABS9HPI4_9GAMM|nr:phytoene/squalene synthase family protein [Lysobacter chinensis]MCF7220851.1 phytoene/squalene synthase family protein [Lysobacter chinensis]
MSGADDRDSRVVVDDDRNGGIAAGNRAALDSFIAKWRQRWPEWGVAEVFVPAPGRSLASAWAALLQEWTDAAWGGRDPRPGEAKLAWWGEELEGWARGARRHPLGAVLQREAVDWPALSATLPALRASRERPRDHAEAFAMLDPFAAAVSEAEDRLFGIDAAVAAETAIAGRDAVAASLLQMRFFHEGDGHVPLAVLARAGEGAPLAIWAEQLRQRWPQAPASTLPRRLWAGLARARLARADPGRPLKPWVSLAVGWRAARARPRN